VFLRHWPNHCQPLPRFPRPEAASPRDSWRCRRTPVSCLSHHLTAARSPNLSMQPKRKRPRSKPRPSLSTISS